MYVGYKKSKYRGASRARYEAYPVFRRFVAGRASTNKQTSMYNAHHL